MRDIVISAFATFYLTWSITTEDGPWKLLRTARNVLKPLDCFVCTCFWVSIVVNVMPRHVCIPLAVAGIAVAIRYPALHFKLTAAMMRPKDASSIPKEKRVD